MTKDDFKFWGVLVGILLIVVGCCAGHFKIWRLIHPDAPAWTYIFR